MTNEELKQLYYLNREIKRCNDKLAELKAEATSTSANITGMPHASKISDKTSLAADIVDQQKELKAVQRKAKKERKRIMAYICNIDDSITRQIFQLRCIDNYNWTMIALSIGGGNTAEGVKRRYYRYIHRTQDK